jgi:hypothetical protein
MTILKEGTTKTYIYECGECGCVFTGDSTEILIWDNVMGISYPVMYCPCCIVKRVYGDAVTEEQLKDIVEELESDKE